MSSNPPPIISSSVMTASSSQNQQQPLFNSEMRMSQIMDETDHKRCSDGNKSALLSETLIRLRGLVKEIADDDWMYRQPNSAEGYRYTAAGHSGVSGDGHFVKRSERFSS